ncbi:MAG TPA: hypothetical protein VFE22_15695 [Edaphobacter sp.]|nr:hypothetical protein [Edaphobacter sp.]
MGQKKKARIVRIVNPPGRKFYTSLRAAEKLVKNGRAAWVLPARDSIRLMLSVVGQAISEESRQKLQEEAIVGPGVGFEWRPRPSGGVMVWQAKRGEVEKWRKKAA